MRDELRRQLSRRRTLVLLASAIVIPLGLAAIFAVRGAPELASGANPQLLNLAASSALAFTIFSLYMCGPLLMIAIAAAFAGDALASEASWGTLRYLLAAPIPRRRLLARKLTSALLLSALALGLLLITSLAAGLIAFGWHPLDTPTGGVLPAADGLVRLLIAVAYVFVTLVPFAVLALLFATMLDTPLAAVGIAAGVAVVSQMVDVIPTLGAARSLLPTHFQLAWTDLFIDP
ncbi:MAG: ABC transporter permease subunit, partial [Gaiellales bacterium]